MCILPWTKKHPQALPLININAGKSQEEVIKYQQRQIQELTDQLAIYKIKSSITNIT
jgi:hypothetical protein